MKQDDMMKKILNDMKDNREEYNKMFDAETEHKYKLVSKKEGEVNLNLYDRIAVLRERGRW